MSEGAICLAEPNECSAGALMCSLPAQTPEEGAAFLEWIGGAAAGTGKRLWASRNMDKLRKEYEGLIQGMVEEVERRRAAGHSSKQVAQWAVAERHKIAIKMRLMSGVGTLAVFEVRDWKEYGVGGRTYPNVERRYTGRGFKGEQLHGRLMQGALSPNTGISNTAIKGARYLKHGGRVILVISIPLTAYTLMTAPEGELERVLYEEAGGFAGGTAGAGVGVGACVVFGIATGGWGLLACGVVGGLVGGAGGAWVGEKIYYSANTRIERELEGAEVLSGSALLTAPPAGMCMAE